MPSEPSNESAETAMGPKCASSRKKSVKNLTVMPAPAEASDEQSRFEGLERHIRKHDKRREPLYLKF